MANQNWNYDEDQIRSTFGMNFENFEHLHCVLEDRPNVIHRRFQNKYVVWLYSQIIANKSHPQTRWYLKSEKAIYSEIQRHVESDNWFIIHPFSNFKLCSSIIMTPISFFLFLTLAYKSAFHVDIARCPDCNCLDFDLVLLNTIILLEIILTFFTGYYTKTEIILDQWQIAKKYLKKYFIIDLLSCLPAMYILKFIDSDQESSTTHLIHDIVALRVLTAPRFFKFLNISAEYFKISDIKRRIIRLCCISILFLHFGVCFYKRIFTAFFNNTKSKVAELMTSPTKTAYEKYFIVVMIMVWRIFSGSSGGFNPTILTQKILGLVTMISSYGFSMYLLIHILHIMETKNISRQKYQEIMRQIDHYMFLRQFPRRLQNRIRLFYEKKFMKTYFKEDIILEVISEPLRKDIVLHCGRIFMEKVKLLEGVPVSIIKSIVSCLKLEIYLPNDPITKAGDFGFCMYFIGVGTVAVFTKSGKEITHLEDGDHFGEFCFIFRDKKRKANVIAISYCEIYRLDLYDYKRTIEVVPEIFERLETLSSRRLDMILIEEERHKQSWTQN